MTVVEVVAKTKFLDDIVAEATRAKILHTEGYAVGVIVQKVVKIVGRPLVDDEHALALALFAFFFVGLFALVYLDVILLSQPAQGFGIGHLLVLHNEADGVSALSATKTVAGATCWRHVERGGLLVMKRAQALIVGPTATQRDKL